MRTLTSTATPSREGKMKLTDLTEYIRSQLNLIEANADRDPEVAHAERDKLYLAVLQYIGSHSHGEPRVLAVMALKAKAIKLRWEACS